MRTVLALAVVLAMPSAARVQAQPNPRRMELSFAYFGELAFHPGVTSGIAYPLLQAPLGVHRQTLLLAGNAGAYLHVRNHAGIFVDSEFGYRLTFRSAFELEGRIGMGYLHTFLGAPVYTVDADGRAERIFDFGRPAFMPTLSLGAGVKLAAFAPFVRVRCFGQYPFNHHLLPHFALQLGVRI